jgi:hypothetical protein
VPKSVLPARFVELELLATGGMGEVYRARDSELGRTVAVKLLAERHARDTDVRERFKREAQAAARLSAHPNIVTVYDVGEHARRPFIVMRYLSGGSVHDRLRAERVEPVLALAWLAEAARGLDAAHASEIVHRDVKPANLLLDEQEHVHVTDFGIASAAGLGFDTLTLPGTVLGTAGYLSPEQARGEPATAASDRYALGVVAFELLTGRRPFASDTPVTEAFAHVTAPVPSARTASPSLPPAVDDVLARALAKDPDERPATATELAEDLRFALRGEEEEPTVVMGATPVHADPAGGRPRPASRRVGPSWPLVVAGAVAILLAGAGTAAVLADGEGSGGERTVTRVRTLVSTVSDTASTQTVTQTTTIPAEAEATDGAALNDAGFERMQAEDFESALPLLERAVAALSGSGSLAEAYASYNLAFTRFALGSCDGVLELLDRSEEVQGEREDIDRLRRDAERQCDGGGGGGPGKGNGRGKGEGNGDD